MYAAPDAQMPAARTIAFTGARIVDGSRVRARSASPAAPGASKRFFRL